VSDIVDSSDRSVKGGQSTGCYKLEVLGDFNKSSFCPVVTTQI
jgi:hypothetical protein